MVLYKRRDYEVYRNNDTDKIDFKKKVVKNKPMYEMDCLL